MRLEELTDRIAYRWRADFLRFIETGRADEAFLAFLDTDADAQAAVEGAFQAQAASFESFAALLNDESGSLEEASGQRAAEAVAGRLSDVVEALPENEQFAVLQRAAEGLLPKLPRELHEEVRALVSEVGEAVGARP